MSFPFQLSGYDYGLRTISVGAGGWKELGRTTLGSAGDTIAVTSLADKRYYMVLADLKQVTGAIRDTIRLNSDTGTNYANRDSENGGADISATSQSYMKNSGSNSYNMFGVGYLANYSTKEKLSQYWNVGRNTTGAATAPTRMESVGKHAQTSNPINAITKFNDGAGDYDTGSEVVVLGWDPADTHTDNFWEELASVELGSAGDTLDTSTITAKKYLWVQAWLKDSGSIRPTLEFNSDTGNNYAGRYSFNGAADGTQTSLDRNYIFQNPQADAFFVNMFIINNSANEKLLISHGTDESVAFAATAPNGDEYVGKWANTSNQITSIQILNDQAGSFDTGSIIKVWGSD